MSFSHTCDELLSTPLYTQRLEMSDNCRFLEVLHTLLEASSDDRKNSSISWRVDGLSFQVHDVQRFERNLLPAYFGSRSDYYIEGDEKSRVLENYDSFSRRLESHNFHRVSCSQDTYSHPLFIRGERRLVEQIICFEEKSFRRRPANTWPMPSLSSSSKTKKREKHFRFRPCRASATKPKKKTSSKFRRNIKIPSALYPVHKQQYSLSLKETLLRRKPTTAYESRNEPKLSIFELLCDIPSSWWSDEANASNDDYEPLRLESNDDFPLDFVRFPDINERSPSYHQACMKMNQGKIDDEDPLDPNSEHEIDLLLEHGEIQGVFTSSA